MPFKLKWKTDKSFIIFLVSLGVGFLTPLLIAIGLADEWNFSIIYGGLVGGFCLTIAVFFFLISILDEPSFLWLGFCTLGFVVFGWVKCLSVFWGENLPFFRANYIGEIFFFVTPLFLVIGFAVGFLPLMFRRKQ